MTDETRLRPRLGHLVPVRYAGFVFGLVLVAAYGVVEPPDWAAPAGYTALVALLVANTGLWVAARRVATTSLPRLAAVNLGVDLLVLSAFVWIYAFDPLSALFAMLVLVPIEGALLFGLPGALAGWAGAAVSYTGREWFAIRFDNPWELDSLLFRVGIIGFVAVVVGLLARDLERQRDAAAMALHDVRRADAWRGRVVAVLAHDLRSPMAAIRMLLDTLDRQDDLEPAVRGELLTRARRRVDEVLALTSDLLDLARSEEGVLQLARRPSRLRELVDEAVTLVGAEQTRVDVPPDLVAEVDPDRFRQVLVNLLGNAVRHGAPPVHVTAGQEQDDLVVTVRDHGPGVPEVLRDRIFEPFAQGTDHGSVGLGTWVVGQLVAAHGGTVTCEGADPGARFVVRIPRSVD